MSSVSLINGHIDRADNPQRERLVDLAEQGYDAFSEKHIGRVISHMDEIPEFIADYLLENGVIVPTFKENQTVYVVDYGLDVWWQGKVISFYYSEGEFINEGKIVYGILFKDGTFGTYTEKFINATKEEAEAKLRGEEK